MIRAGFGFALACLVVSATAVAQLPSDAVKLDKVKISEKQKTSDFDPVTLKPADPALGTFAHDDVTYGISDKASEAEFKKDPAKYAEAATKQRWENNFVASMSRIWCPVTDEINAGGGLIWNELGMEWESCCQFCNDTKTDEDFPRALERLKKRAAESFELAKGTYTEGASSPVEGAIDLGGDGEAEAGAEIVPAWLEGKELKPTYSEGAALVIENRCIECHRLGGAAPMSLMTYQDIRKWSAKMKAALTLRTMPPWPADSGHFANAKRLTQTELDTLVAWVDAGYPKGEGEHAPSRDWTGEWTIGEPDHIFDLPAVTLAEASAEEIKEVEIETNLDEDKWIVASEVHATDPFLVLQIEAGPLGSYHAGNAVKTAPEKTGYLLKKGEKIKVRIFYTKEAGWDATDDMTQFGVVFAKNPAGITKDLETDRMGNDEFTVPAGKADVAVNSEFTFPADGQIRSLTPVSRFRTTSMTCKAVAPDGKETVLVNIPHWDPAWHFTYELAEPVAAPKGTKVVVSAVFDNSEDNVKNPDASVEVKAGPNGEVLDGWIRYTLD